MINITFVNQSAFLLGTLLVCVSCLIYTMAQRHTDRPQNIIYMMSVITLGITAISDIVFHYELPMAGSSTTARYAAIAADFVYFLLHMLLPMLMLYYALFATRNFHRVSIGMHILYLAPCVICELLVVLSPRFELVWRYDEEMHVVRQAGVYLLYAASVFYFVYAVFLLLWRWSPITRTKRLIIVFSVAIGILGVLVQMIFPNIITELFSESVALMGLMLAIEYDEDRLDTPTGIYNRLALVQDTRSYFENNMKLYVICVRFTNIEMVQRVLGTSDNEEIQRMIASYLMEVHPRYLIYRATPSAFILLHVRGNEGQVRFLSQMISWKMEEGWEYQGRKLSLHGVILYACIPTELHNPEDILLMCESPLPVRDDENGAVLVGDDLRAILYRSNLETALHRGLAEHNFRVYYQPVYTADGEHIYSAESLIRLNDPEFGELFPGDFIPAAERNGMIEQLGEYTLEEVCRFLESGVPGKLGIRYINVNLSVVQCMNPDFAATVKRIVEKHTVLPSWINFEITETVAALDYAALDAVIKELKAEGFMFSMEGYGTGFSNLYSIFSLDFDMIKMDKRLLWEADKSEDGWTILENSVRLVHELSHEVVIVGVENKEQFENSKRLAVDWYQGNYFSRPLTRNELEKMV